MFKSGKKRFGSEVIFQYLQVVRARAPLTGSALVSDLLNLRRASVSPMIHETIEPYRDISIYIKTCIMQLQTKTAISLFTGLFFVTFPHTSSILNG